jgi:bacteriorhodopsin
MIPAEALGAVKLLWGYYLTHVVVIVVIMWGIFALVSSMDTAVVVSFILLIMSLMVEIWQLCWPVLGDAGWDDVLVDTGTILICGFIFFTIRLRGRMDIL